MSLKKKIIHFENDPYLAQMYKVNFEKVEINVVHFLEPPKNVVGVVASEKPDLIIMDIIMPKIDGYKLTELLKKDGRTKDIPIFGLDNLAQKEDIKKAHDVGMVDYWIKADHTPSRIVKKVQILLNDT